jgi:hypothetical protein
MKVYVFQSPLVTLSVVLVRSLSPAVVLRRSQNTYQYAYATFEYVVSLFPLISIQQPGTSLYNRADFLSRSQAAASVGSSFDSVVCLARNRDDLFEPEDVRCLGDTSCIVARVEDGLSATGSYKINDSIYIIVG